LISSGLNLLLLLQKRRSGASSLNELRNYHINFISLLIIFEETDFYQPLRKARAVIRWPPLWEEVGRRPSKAYRKMLLFFELLPE